jgi:5'-deoxynucleotidase YfbR-like HD superfamily hydrolase
MQTEQTKIFELDRLSLVMNGLNRYCTTPSLLKESVAEHSYLIALMIIEFSHEYTKLFQYVDRENLLMRAILHDLCESVTGDIPSPAKRALPECEHLFAKVEEAIANQICEGRSNEFKELLLSAINFDDTNNMQQLLFKCLDLFCVLVKTSNELMMGNMQYLRVVDEMSTVISKLQGTIYNLSQSKKGSVHWHQYDELCKFFNAEIFAYLNKLKIKYNRAICER